MIDMNVNVASHIPTSIIPAHPISSLDRGHSQRAHRADVPVRSPRQCDVGAPCVSDCTLGLRCICECWSCTYLNRPFSQEMVKTFLCVWHCTVIRNRNPTVYFGPCPNTVRHSGQWRWIGFPPYKWIDYLPPVTGFRHASTHISLHIY